MGVFWTFNTCLFSIARDSPRFGRSSIFRPLPQVSSNTPSVIRTVSGREPLGRIESYKLLATVFLRHPLSSSRGMESFSRAACFFFFVFFFLTAVVSSQAFAFSNRSPFKRPLLFDVYLSSSPPSYQACAVFTTNSLHLPFSGPHSFSHAFPPLLRYADAFAWSKYADPSGTLDPISDHNLLKTKSYRVGLSSPSNRTSPLTAPQRLPFLRLRPCQGGSPAPIEV